MGEGPSMAKCFMQAQGKVSRDLYLGEIQTMAVSTHLSTTLLFRALSALNRTGSFDKTPLMFTTTQTPSQFTAFHTAQNNFPALYFVDLFSCQHCQTDALGVRFWQFSSDYLTPGIDPYLPEIHVSSSGNAVSANQVALYRHLQYISTLNPDETMTFGLLKGLARKVSLFLPNQEASLRNIHGSSNLQVERRHHQIDAIFRVKLASTLQSIKTQSETAQQLSLLSQEASRLLARRSVAFLRRTQKLDVDPLGVGRQLDWRHPHTFQAFGSWHKAYPKVVMTVHVTLRINRMGDVK